MIPERDTRPTVGLMPTRALTLLGHTIEPSVSVPTATTARSAAIAAPDPELEPQGLRWSAYGLRVCPPRPLQPLVECVERKLAHSLRLVLPRISAPAWRNLRTMKASRGGLDPTRASDPAVVCMPSPVSMLSFSNTGTPKSGRLPLPAESSSRAR